MAILLINKNDIDKYRFAVAKHVFLITYDQYHLIKDYPNTNCMLVDTDGESIIISLLGKPQEKSILYPVKIFKQKSSSEGEKLSKQFIELFDAYLMKALISPKQLNSSFLDSPFFESFLKSSSSVRYSNESVFKHYSESIFTNDKHGRIEGNISFAIPDSFNDPFDCKCSYPNPGITNIFRVFCTIPIKDSVLMWAHYSSEHKGYCFEYKVGDIIDQMMTSSIDGLIIVGNVKYSKKRPTIRPSKPKVSYSDLKYYIEATFTKYSGWSYEKEFRFVFVSDSFTDAYVSFKVPVINTYVGYKGKPDNLIKGTTTLKPRQMKLSKSDYELYC